MLVDEREHPVNELLALEIANLSQRDGAAEMIVPVRVTARTAERTFPRDLDGE
jgi:hypothetical protein